MEKILKRNLEIIYNNELMKPTPNLNKLQQLTKEIKKLKKEV